MKKLDPYKLLYYYIIILLYYYVIKLLILLYKKMSQITYYQRNREAILNARKKLKKRNFFSFWRMKVNKERERERERERGRERDSMEEIDIKICLKKTNKDWNNNAWLTYTVRHLLLLKYSD